MGQQAEISWTDGGTPVSQRFDDPYFSKSDGFAETGHVFLAGNDLPARLRPGFEVAELGFGTGLNAIALALIVPPGCAVRMTSFEAFAMGGGDAGAALGALDLPDGAGVLIEQVVSALDAGRDEFALGSLAVTLVQGDARASLPRWQGCADAWFLDGFSPAKNPELWEPALMAEVGAHTRPGGTFATYSAAGTVRRALEAAGFEVERAPGFGRKRHMSKGVLKGARQ